MAQIVLPSPQPFHTVSASHKASTWAYSGLPPFKIDHNKSQNQELEEYFLQSFALEDKLFSSIINQKALYTRPEPLRHPLIFYYGHTSSVYINKLVEAGLIHQTINPHYECMFAVGVNQMNWDDLTESNYEWPTVSQTNQFRQKAKELMLTIIRQYQGKIGWYERNWAIIMGIEHQLIHLETSAMIIKKLPVEDVAPLPDFPLCPFRTTDLSHIPKNALVEVPAYHGQYHLHPDSLDRYVWDNEIGDKDYHVAPFKASKYLVSNGEYFDFVREGGFLEQSFWSVEGWAWRSCVKAEHPLFWVKREGGWRLRTVLEEIDMPWDWPVEVNNHEARAFCKWKSSQMGCEVRLPTEDEYDALLAQVSPAAQHNLHLNSYFSVTPINMYRSNSKFFDIIGNLWQLTCSPYKPYYNFQTHPYYQDFSLPCFDENHDVLRGACWISCGAFGHPNNRNFFRRHFHQFSGFRYVQGPPVAECPADALCCGDPEVVDSFFTQFHNEPNYVLQLQQLLLPLLNKDRRSKALTIGCSVGRLCFILGRHFETSVGLDSTTRFFLAATRLQQKGRLDLTPLLGANSPLKEVDLAKLGLPSKNVQFFQQRPDNIDCKKFNGFDLVVVDGVALQCRQCELKEVTKRAVRQLEEGGLLAVCVPQGHDEGVEKLQGNKQKLEIVLKQESLGFLTSKEQQKRQCSVWIFRQT